MLVCGKPAITDLHLTDLLSVMLWQFRSSRILLPGDCSTFAAMFGFYEFVSRYFLSPKLIESKNK